MKPSPSLLAVPLAAAVLLAAGCGGSDNGSSYSSGSSGSSGSNATSNQKSTAAAAGSGQENSKGTIDVSADPNGQLAYVPDQLTGRSGMVKVDFTNDTAVGHSIVIDAPGGQEVAKTPVFSGGSEVASFSAKPGNYTFYCSVPGHREAGMQGTLTVK